MCDVNNLPLDDMKRGPLLNIRGYEVIRCYVMHRLVLLQCCFAFFDSAHVAFGLETTEMKMCWGNYVLQVKKQIFISFGLLLIVTCVHMIRLVTDLCS